MTSGNYYTYNWKLAEYFSADLVPIAYSGKGMYKNCCDDGETMPSYYLQTLASKAYEYDWDFTLFKPDMLLINLGTNDMNKYSGEAWGKEFVATYVEFV
jgi:lysophospholipase L1-like esterase